MMGKYDSLSKAALLAELLECAKVGDNESIQEVLRYKLDLNHFDEKGNSALLLAVQRDHFDTADILLAHGADINARDDEGCTTLLRAVAGKHRAAVKYLIDHGADVNGADSKGRTPLLVAVVAGDFDTMNMLLQHKADPNAGAGDGEDRWTPLIAAAVGAHYTFLGQRFNLDETLGDKRGAFIAALLQSGASHREKVGDAHLLYLSVKNEWPAVFNLLMKGDIDQDSLDEAMWYCVGTGKIKAAQALIQKGANVNREDTSEDATNVPTLLGQAVLKDNVEMVKLLIASGANTTGVATDGSSALEVATSQGKNQVARYLVGTTQRPSEQPHSSADVNGLLVTACANGNHEMVRKLIEQGADVSATDAEGHSPLIAASYNGHLDIARALVEKGAKIDYQRPKPEAGVVGARTALSQSVLGNQPEVERYLLEQGAKFDQIDVLICKYATRYSNMTNQMRSAIGGYIEKNDLSSECIDLLVHHFRKEGLRSNGVTAGVVLLGVVIWSVSGLAGLGIFIAVGGALIWQVLSRTAFRKRKTGAIKHVTLRKSPPSSQSGNAQDGGGASIGI